MPTVQDVKTGVSDAKTAIALVENPNALYAAALSVLGDSPAAKALLSPIGQELFHAAYQAVTEEIGSLTTTLSDAVQEGAVALGVTEDAINGLSNVAATIGEAIGDAIPIINVFVAIVQVVMAFPQATGSPDMTQEYCAVFWSTEPSRSGPADPVSGLTSITPQDIFNSDYPATRANDNAATFGTPAFLNEPLIPAMRNPRSALGMCLAAITEPDPLADVPENAPRDISNARDDTPDQEYQWHSPSVFYGTAPLTYKHMTGEANVGVTPETSRCYGALRRAIASNGPDKGVLPWALFMDLLTADFDAGRLSRGYIEFLISSHFREPGYPDSPVVDLTALGFGVSFFQQSPCGAASGMADQIVALINSWKKTRADITKPKGIKLHLGKGQEPGAIQFAMLRNSDLSPAGRAAAIAVCDKLGVGAKARFYSASSMSAAEILKLTDIPASIKSTLALRAWKKELQAQRLAPAAHSLAELAGQKHIKITIPAAKPGPGTPLPPAAVKK